MKATSPCAAHTCALCSVTLFWNVCYREPMKELPTFSPFPLGERSSGGNLHPGSQLCTLPHTRGPALLAVCCTPPDLWDQLSRRCARPSPLHQARRGPSSVALGCQPWLCLSNYSAFPYLKKEGHCFSSFLLHRCPLGHSDHGASLKMSPSPSTMSSFPRSGQG